MTGRPGWSAGSSVDALDPRTRIYRADATLWVWIAYGLTQATITMLMAFDVIKTLTASEVCTAVALIIYVAVNEILVRPGWRRRRSDRGDAGTDRAGTGTTAIDRAASGG